MPKIGAFRGRAVEGLLAVDSRLAIGRCGGGVDAVGDGQRAIAGVAHEAAAMGGRGLQIPSNSAGGDNLAVEHAGVNGQMGVGPVGLYADDAAMGAVA